MSKESLTKLQNLGDHDAISHETEVHALCLLQEKSLNQWHVFQKPVRLNLG